MPARYRLARSALSFDPRHAHRDLPVRPLWIEALPWSGEILHAHPIFREARLTPVFRDLMRDNEHALLREIRHEERGPAMALVWRSPGRRFAPTDRHYAVIDPMAAYGDYGPVYRRGRDWVGMNAEVVWTAGGGRTDDLVVGYYVQILAGLDADGCPMPVEPQGPIPPDDEEFLGNLAH